MATHSNEIEIGQQAINLTRRLYWCEGLGEGQITNFIDPFGEDTDDPDDAVQAIVRIRDDCWLNVDLTGFERAGREH